METELLTLIMANQWIALGAILIGCCIRLLKMQRVQLLLHIPGRYLPLVALLLGQVQAVLEWIVADQDPLTAIVKGFIAAAFAIGGHEALVEGLLGGRELGRTPEVRGMVRTPLPPPQREQSPTTMVINVTGADEAARSIRVVRDALVELEHVADPEATAAAVRDVITGFAFFRLVAPKMTGPAPKRCLSKNPAAVDGPAGSTVGVTTKDDGVSWPTSLRASAPAFLTPSQKKPATEGPLTAMRVV